MELYLYAFINAFINPKTFEIWIYDNLELISKEISSQNLFLNLISCNYQSSNDVEHLKKLILKEYKNIFNSFTYDSILNSGNNELISIIKREQNKSNIIIFDCTNIDSTLKLQQEIQRKFDFPEWYGENWNAFEDLLDLTELLILKFINYTKMSQLIPDDSKRFIQILNNHKNKFHCNFKLVFDNKIDEINEP